MRIDEPGGGEGVQTVTSSGGTVVGTSTVTHKPRAGNITRFATDTHRAPTRDVDNAIPTSGYKPPSGSTGYTPTSAAREAAMTMNVVTEGNARNKTRLDNALRPRTQGVSGMYFQEAGYEDHTLGRTTKYFRFRMIRAHDDAPQVDKRQAMANAKLQKGFDE